MEGFMDGMNRGRAYAEIKNLERELGHVPVETAG
jgi:hypothetical protein